MVSIDGTDISGATIDGTDVSEITIDGEVAWSDVPDIPDSVVYQWRVEEFADPWPANVGDEDMSITGLSSSTFSNDEDSVYGDEDYGRADGPQKLPKNEQFTVAFTTEYPNQAGDVYWGGSQDGVNDIQIRTDAEGPDGNIGFVLTDDYINRLRVHTDSAYGGDERAVVIVKSGNSTSDIDIYVDDMDTPVAKSVVNDQAFDPGIYSNSEDFVFWDWTNGGKFQYQNIEADVGVFEFANEAYDQAQREGFVSRRPEV